MNLDFTALARPGSLPTKLKSWGQAGTVGTQAFMRVPVLKGDGDGLGIVGDMGRSAADPSSAAVDEGTAGSAICPQVSPPRPQFALTRKPSVHVLSPLSPIVPKVATRNASSDDFEHEAFEERAAIMEFDGGMTRADAEAAASQLFST